MAIRINARELLEILEGTPASQNILLVGRHGIGKSEILTEHYTKKGLRVVALFLGQMSDPGDLIGLPARDDVTGHTRFMPPYWWPLEGKPVALFLDELNRARPEILQSVHDLALNRTLAGRRLPEGSVVISAINAGEEYQVTDLDPALASRFNVYEFTPEVDEWIAWARKHGVDRRVIAFIAHEQRPPRAVGRGGRSARQGAGPAGLGARLGARQGPAGALTPLLVKTDRRRRRRAGRGGVRQVPRRRGQAEARGRPAPPGREDGADAPIHERPGSGPAQPSDHAPPRRGRGGAHAREAEEAPRGRGAVPRSPAIGQARRRSSPTSST